MAIYSRYCLLTKCITKVSREMKNIIGRNAQMVQTDESNGGFALKTSPRIIAARDNLEPSNHGVGWTTAAALLHLLNRIGSPRKESLNGAIPPISNPTLQPQLGGVLNRPVPVENPLNPSLHHHPNSFGGVGGRRV